MSSRISDSGSSTTLGPRRAGAASRCSGASSVTVSEGVATRTLTPVGAATWTFSETVTTTAGGSGDSMWGERLAD